MKALTALNRNISAVNCVELEKKEALAAFSYQYEGDNGVYRKNSGVSGVEPEKSSVKRQITGKIAAFTAFFCRYKGTQCV